MLGLKAQVMGVDLQLPKNLLAPEQAGLLFDIVKLHREDVTAALQKLPVHQQREGKPQLMPGRYARLELLQHLEPCLFEHDDNVEVRGARHEIGSGATAVEGNSDEVIGEELTDFLSELGEGFFALSVKHIHLGPARIKRVYDQGGPE